MHQALGAYYEQMLAAYAVRSANAASMLQLTDEAAAFSANPVKWFFLDGPEQYEGSSSFGHRLTLISTAGGPAAAAASPQKL